MANIENVFMYHTPKADQPARYQQIRDKAKELAYTFAKCCPDSRELENAMTFLETAVMHANASIARNE